MIETLNHIIQGNAAPAWLLAAGVAAGSALLLLAIRRLVLLRLTRMAKRTATELDDIFVGVLGRTRYFFMLALSVYAGSRVLWLPADVTGVLQVVVALVLFLQSGIWANAAIDLWLKHRISRTVDEFGARTTTLLAFHIASTIVVWSLVLFLSLSALGVNATALLTGLGIGGIAIALAVQKVFGDVFAALSIFLDKPFIVGDFIVVNETRGTIERIGLKSTRIRSLNGELIILSNAGLLESRIHNYRHLIERRVVHTVDVAMDVRDEDAEAIPALLKDIVGRHAPVRFDRSHLKEFTASAFRYELVYFILDPDFNTSMDIQQSINLAILREFRQRGIAFAYPMQTVLLGGTSAAGSALRAVPAGKDAQTVS